MLYSRFSLVIYFIHSSVSVDLLCPTLWDPVDCNLPKFLAFPALAGRFLTTSTTWEALISYTVVYMCQSQSPNSSHSPFSPWCPYVCSLYLCLYFCFADRFICTIFLDSTFVFLSLTLLYMTISRSSHCMADSLCCTVENNTTL